MRNFSIGKNGATTKIDDIVQFATSFITMLLNRGFSWFIGISLNYMYFLNVKLVILPINWNFISLPCKWKFDSGVFYFIPFF